MIERVLFALLIATILWIGFVVYRRYHAGRIQQQVGGAEAESVNRPRLLFFHGTYCAACGQQERYLNQLDPQYWPLVEPVHVEHQPELAEMYGVMTIPMTVLIAADQSVQHINYGLTDTNQLETQLRPLVTGAIQEN